jgi:LmbE family N-acetylglucosaminyl deacetylase
MCAVLALACAVALLLGEPTRALAAGPCSGNVVYVVAHEDDTLLFQSPQLLEDVRANKCVQTVFTTAGDAGKLGNGGKYWKGREAGAEAAYAQMAAAANTWTHSEPVVNGHKVHLATLSGAPGISIVYLRLPDGGPNGTGFPNPPPEPGGPSLTKLWRSANGGTPSISEIEAVDGSAKYTYNGLVSTLTALIESFAPLEINTQNYTIPALVELDHADHIVTGKFTQVAQATYLGAHVLRAFQGYENFVATKSEPPANVFEPLLSSKREAFMAYVPHDEACTTKEEDCEAAPYPEWLEREYVAAKESVPGANAGLPQTVVPGASVQLDGSGSFDPGDSTPSLTYAWVQTAGPKVTLSSPTAAKPTFTAPAGPTALVFSLKVKNGAENGSHESLAASVTVNVETPPPPPPPSNGGGGGGGGGNAPPPPNIVVKLSRAKVKLVVGKASKHLVKVIAPGKSAVKCRGQLPKGARCRVNAQSDVVVESSKRVKQAGTFHLVVDFAWQSGVSRRPLTVVFKRSGR